MPFATSSDALATSSDALAPTSDRDENRHLLWLLSGFGAAGGWCCSTVTEFPSRELHVTQDVS